MGFFQTISTVYGIRTSHFMKEWSNNSRKMAGLLNRRIFLLECKRLKLTPGHIGTGMKNVLSLFEFNVGSRFNRKIIEFNKNLVNKVLSLEIEHTHLRIKHIHDNNIYIEGELRQLVPSVTLQEFFKHQRVAYNKIFDRIKSTNMKKIKDLQRKSHKVTYNIQEKWFKNLSSIQIPEEVKTILALGSKFSIPMNPRELNIRSLIADVENILDTVEENKRDSLRAKISSIIANFLHRNKNITSHMNKLYKTTKEFLKTNNQLIVLNIDKGSVTVLMDRSDYLDRMHSVLNTGSFRQVPKDPTTTI